MTGHHEEAVVTTPDAALQTALAAEHAAIYGYGALGAYLTGSARVDAVAAEAAHRARRDALLLRMADAGTAPTPAAPAYTLPLAVTGPATALRLAVGVEERTAAAWRAAVPATAAEDRETAIAALTDCAVRATRWRRRAEPSAPATVPFPGS
ncbi:MAG TPA: ferritin-like domain-containing protein [Mycobacteriales bacterium]|nr:ferritin-like domain-containing protein [Mycobacteriales bacterium]